MDKFSVKKSYRDGCIGLRFSLKANGWNALKVEGGSDLPTAEARALADAIIAEADRADAKVAAKKAADERRQKYREREIAAGRLNLD